MRTYDEYKAILELWEQGYAKKRIACITGIPRATVRDCITRYGRVVGLEADKLRASRSTPDEVLNQICDPTNDDIQRAYSYLLGMYLGDGYIARNKRVYFLRIAMDAQHKNIINRCVSAIETILPHNKVNVLPSTQGNWVEVICTHKFWPEVFPQHGKGPKHKREIKLLNWQ